MKEKNFNEPITEDDLLVYGAYARVAYSLQHSNRIQLSFKTMTFTWILATYIGIGYTISSKEVSLPLHPLITVPIICVASLLVIGIIWYLDLIVEEKKIASAVHKGLKLEEKYPDFLPEAYHNVVSLNYLLGYVSMKSVFYLAWSFILILTMAASIAAYLYIQKFTYWLFVPLLTAILMPILYLVSNKMTKKTDPYPVLDRLHIKKGNDGNPK